MGYLYAFLIASGQMVWIVGLMFMLNGLRFRLNPMLSLCLLALFAVLFMDDLTIFIK